MDCQVTLDLPRDCPEAPRGGEHPWGFLRALVVEIRPEGVKQEQDPQLWLTPVLSEAWRDAGWSRHPTVCCGDEFEH